MHETSLPKPIQESWRLAKTHLFVEKDKQGGVSQILFAHELRQFGVSFVEPLFVAGVHHEQDRCVAEKNKTYYCADATLTRIRIL